MHGGKTVQIKEEKKMTMMLDKIKQKALDEHIPIIMDDTLEVVDKLLKEVKPNRILEIGTAVGYSAICFSKYLSDDGYIDTIERDEERVKENSLMEFVIRKHRNGPLADVPLIFQRPTSTFVNVANVKEEN